MRLFLALVFHELQKITYHKLRVKASVLSQQLPLQRTTHGDFIQKLVDLPPVSTREK
jgi:hypothetical protein